MSNGVTESVSTAIDRDRLSGAKLSAWIKSPERSASELAAFEGRSTALDRLIASHECASTETLSRLSHSSDRATRSRVCKNPNTPTAEYLRLGQQFPVEFLANPILDFLLLENPALLKEASSSLLIRLLKSKQCPEAFLVWAASHPEEKVQLAVAMNPSLPQRAIDPLKASANPRVREAAEATELGDLTPEKAEQAFVQALAKRIAQLDREAFTEAWKKKDIGLAQWPLLTLGMKLELIGWQLTSEFAVTEILELFAKEPASRFRRQVADNRNTPPALLDTLSKDVDADMREAVASNPAILINTLALLALDPDSNVRRAVAKNTNTPIHVLETLAGDLAQEVRAEVGGNTNTSEQVLETLAKDAEKWVRSVVASNKNAKARVLETLATDIEEDVRHSVGLNPNTPAAVLEALARDLSSRVRSGVANNPNTPPNVLEILAKDMHDYVKWLVSLNPNTSELVLETLAEHTEARVRSGVASNRNTPVAVLETLCRDSDYDVWRKTCSNPNTPLAALDKLANAPSLWIRENFASSNFAHGAPLLRLAKDTHIRVREAVAQNRNTPALVLETLARDQYEGVCRAVAQNPNTPAFVLETLARVQYEGVRRAVAQNVNTPAPLLALLSRHRNFQIRLAVTRNPSTPSQALKDLACDTDVRISVEALQHKSLDSVTALKAIEYLTNRNGSWYQKQLKKVSIDERKAIESCNVLFFSGKDPNHSVLAKRALAPIMALCAGPYIEPSRIAKVVSSSDWLVRAAVARNRGTPENLLKRLASDVHPVIRTLANSPVLTQLTKDPSRDFLDHERIFHELAIRESRKGTFPMFLDDKFLASIITKNLGKEIESLDKDSLKKVSTVNALTVLIGRLPLDDYSFKRLHKVTAYRRSIAANSHAPVELLRKLAKSRDWKLRIAVATNSSVPADTLVNLISDPEEWVSSMARVHAIERNLVDQSISNPDSPPRFPSETRSRETLEVLRRIADDPCAPRQVLRQLGKSTDADLRMRVARNRNVPQALIEDLQRDQDGWIASTARVQARANKVSNKRSLDSLAEISVPRGIEPAELFRAIVQCDFTSHQIDNQSLTMESRSSDWLRRLTVALHPNASKAILALLKLDVDQDVAIAASMPRMCPQQDDHRADTFVFNGQVFEISIINFETPCPSCGAQLEQLEQRAECTTCDFFIPLTLGKRSLTINEIETLLRDREVGPLIGFRGKRGNFSAILRLNTNNRLSLEIQNEELCEEPKSEIPGLSKIKENELYSYETKHNPTSFTVSIPCPKCGAQLARHEQRAHCTICDFVVTLVPGNREFSSEEIEELLLKRRVGPLSGFKSHRGADFSATLRLDKDHRLTFDFGHGQDEDEDENDPRLLPHIGSCPKCTGRVLEQALAYACEQSLTVPKRCDFRSSKVILQQPVSTEQMQKLLLEGKTDLLQDFVSSKTGRKFRAYLTLDPQGKWGFEFAPRADRS